MGSSDGSTNSERRHMHYTYNDYLCSAEYIKNMIKFKPEVGIFLGSGLGGLCDLIEDKIEIDCNDIPNFPKRIALVKGHSGKIIAGNIDGKNIIVLTGRFHIYEGYSAFESVFPVRCFKLLGIEKIIFTNAAGGVNDKYIPGDLMLIKDHLSFFCPSPLNGPNIDEFGTRFPDMAGVYSEKLSWTAKECAKDIGFDLKEGIYAYMKGPMYESPAEVTALRGMGADAVGMSTVAEVITAAQAGMEILGISCIANVAADLKAGPITHNEVLEVANQASKNFIELIQKIIDRI